MTQDAAGAPQFTIGRVLETSFAVLVRNIVPFGVLALGLGVLDLLAEYATGVVASRTIQTVVSDTGTQVYWGFHAPSTLLGIATFLISVVIGNLVTELLDIPAILRAADLNVARTSHAHTPVELAN